MEFIPKFIGFAIFAWICIAFAGLIATHPVLAILGFGTLYAVGILR